MAAIVFLAMEDTVTIATGNLESNKFYQNYIVDYLPIFWDFYASYFHNTTQDRRCMPLPTLD